MGSSRNAAYPDAAASIASFCAFRFGVGIKDAGYTD
jgi:hypothetical protein